MTLRMFEQLVMEWRDTAQSMDEWGAESSAAVIEHCADQLEVVLRDWLLEELSLQPAAVESGYSSEHLGRLVREGAVPNAGRPNAPRIRRCDLPRKPGRSGDVGPIRRELVSKQQIARSVANSRGGSDG
jgi:hypothetical protein